MRSFDETVISDDVEFKVPTADSILKELVDLHEVAHLYTSADWQHTRAKKSIWKKAREFIYGTGRN